MRDMDDLIKKLTDKVVEEIEGLPEDGQDHEFRIKIKGNRGNINLGYQSVEIHHGKEPPPAGSDRERICPQCGKPTWRFTQLCMHCDYDLHHHDQTVAREETAARQQAFQQKMMIIFGVAISAGLSIFYVKRYLPDWLQSWAFIIAIGCGFIAFIAMKAGETAK